MYKFLIGVNEDNNKYISSKTSYISKLSYPCMTLLVIVINRSSHMTKSLILWPTSGKKLYRTHYIPSATKTTIVVVYRKTDITPFTTSDQGMNQLL